MGRCKPSFGLEQLQQRWPNKQIIHSASIPRWLTEKQRADSPDSDSSKLSSSSSSKHRTRCSWKTFKQSKTKTKWEKCSILLVRDSGMQRINKPRKTHIVCGRMLCHLERLGDACFQNKPPTKNKEIFNLRLMQERHSAPPTLPCPSLPPH